MAGAAAIFVAPLVAAAVGAALCRPVPDLQAPGALLAMLAAMGAVRALTNRTPTDGPSPEPAPSAGAAP